MHPRTRNFWLNGLRNMILFGGGIVGLYNAVQVAVAEEGGLTPAIVVMTLFVALIIFGLYSFIGSLMTDD